MNSLIELRFLNDDANENDGLGDAGIETYKDAIYASIAREAAQNSADAWKKKPVMMKFDLIEIERKDLPALEKYQKTINICLEQAKKEKDEKATDFFKRAKEILNEDKIKVLRVEDFNTKGLTGPCERGTPFHSLVKGSGISVKESETSGGSFGIGKNAAFAVSELQTVFYSSQYLTENNTLQFIAQGKSILVSHVDETGQQKKGKGYWGLPGYKEVSNIRDVPRWLQRLEQGTSIFSIGFRFLQNWQYKMAASLISNFFCAIHRGDMEFSVNNREIVIDKKTLSELFNNSEIKRGAEDNNSLEAFEFAKSLFFCITSPYTKEKILVNDVMGKVSIKILVNPDLPKRLALIRNGMIITDSLEFFGDKFARFPMSKEFVAIVEALEDKGNSLIKKLENPRHDGLSAERLHDPKKSREANAAIKSLIKQIRNAIKEETITIPDNEVTVDELTEFFADDSTRETTNDSEHEDNIETFVYQVTGKLPAQQQQTPSSVNHGKNSTKGNRTELQGDSIGAETNGSKGENRNSRDQTQNNRNGNTGQKNELNITDVRNIFINEGGKFLRRVFFTSPLTCQAQITIQATGINEIDLLVLASVRSASINANTVILDVKEGQRSFFDVEFFENYNGPIQIIAYTSPNTNVN